MVARICNERTGATTAEWVKGHSGDKWNERADVEAKDAHSHTGTEWQVDVADQDDIKYSATMAGTRLDYDTRHVLKMQTTRRWHQEWMALKRTKRANRDHRGTDWPGSLSIIHSNKPVHTFFSSQQDTRLRSHRIKKIHGMLPTMDALHARRLDLYPNDRCRLCHVETEDNDHIWTCTESREARKALWIDAMKRVDGWGLIATRHYNKEQKENSKTGKPAPRPIVWRTPRALDCGVALRRLIIWPSLEDGKKQFTGESGWTVCHLFQGFVPKALTTKWSPVFQDPPKSIVQHVCRLFCRFVEKEGREKLWKPRYERTVECEKQQGITEKRKHNKSTTQRDQNEWQQIYGRRPQENECLCGHAIDVHEAGRCPGE